MKSDNQSSSMDSFFTNQAQIESRQRRWRLVLGQIDDQPSAPGDDEGSPGQGIQETELTEQEQAMDKALEALYGDSGEGDLSDSNPDIARWLGDIRKYFPDSVVQIMQRDAMNRLNLRKLLAQPDFLEAVEPDLNLVSNILALKKVMPKQTRETAKEVVRKVVEDLQEKLAFPLKQALAGSLDRAQRTRRPKHHDINWLRTIHTNLKHYQPEYEAIIPETMVGYGRRRSSARDVILAVDTSGSMTTSVVYASIYAAVMASINSITTRVVMFDTKVVDVTDQMDDPVETLFGIRLGGGTNIDRALGYCQQLVARPNETILILISDLFEGGNKDNMLRRIGTLVQDGVTVICLLALNDQGAPRFNRTISQQLVNLGVTSFACTPEQFPDLMAAAIDGRDIQQWASRQQIVTAPDN